MLTHGKQVRRVSFLLGTMKALSGAGLRRIGKVSFWLVVVITEPLLMLNIHYINSFKNR